MNCLTYPLYKQAVLRAVRGGIKFAIKAGATALPGAKAESNILNIKTIHVDGKAYHYLLSKDTIIIVDRNLSGREQLKVADKIAKRHNIELKKL